MLFSLKKYNIGEKSKQLVLRLFNKPILIGSSEHEWYVRFGNPGFGLSATSNPKFSIIHNKKKSIKIGKYYFSKI